MVLLVGNDGDVPAHLALYIDGTASLPVQTWFIGGYGKNNEPM